MAPPKFADLGKLTSDLLGDDYGFGASKLTLKSRARNGVNFKVDGTKSNKSNTLDASVETKFSTKNGVAIKEKWKSSNQVTTEVSVSNKLVAGSKIIGEIGFSPSSGIKSVKCTGEYGCDKFFGDITATSKTASASGVFSYGKYLVGGELGYDVAGSAISGTKFGLGFRDTDVAIDSIVTNTPSGAEVAGSIFHKPSAAIEAGVSFSWSRSADTGFEVGGKYRLDNDSFCKAKINRNCVIGLSYTQKLRPGVSATFAAKVNAAQMNSSDHQLGFSLTLEN
jgi:hypothetical protein